MQVIRATAMGLCFGVRDALRTAAQVERPDDVTIHGELVHNGQVLVQLQQRGFHMVAENQRDALPSTSAVLVTAHGISDAERGRLLAAEKRLIDTTCPLVRRVHETAQRLASEGFHVLLIGRPGHVEVRGITEDLARCDVLAAASDVRQWPHERLGIICQTTTPPQLAADAVRAIEFHNPQAEIRFINTICQPTLERQHAVEQLCRLVDAVVVVGGANSNNTRQLVELARRHGMRTWQVQTAADLQHRWFHGCRRVGLTAGTSTLDDTVQAVHEALVAMPPS